MKTLKAVVIGCGAIAERKHIPALIRIPEVEVVGVCDANLERAKAVADRLGIDRWYERYRDVMGSADLAIVSTPNSTHSQISCELLERGIHVMCEKPMAISGRECEAMIRASESGQAKLMIGHYMRYTSNIQIAKALLKQKAVEGIRSIVCSFGNVFHWPSVTNFYNSAKLSGGGVLIDYGVHLIDALWWLTGEEVRLSRYVICGAGKGGVEEEVDIEFELGTAVKGRMLLSRNRKLTNTLEIQGDSGGLKVYLDNYQNIDFYRCGITADKANEPISIVGEKCDPYLKQAEDFVECIRVGKSPSPSGVDGLRTLKFVDACYRVASPGDYASE